MVKNTPPPKNSFKESHRVLGEHTVVSQKMVVGIYQASGYLVLDEGRMGAGRQRIDIHVVEEYRNI
jgi:hypothetical protein